MGNEVSKENLETVDELFKSLDKDGNKQLSEEELKKWTVDWAHKFIFDKFDTNKDGKVDWKEFKNYVDKHDEEITEIMEKSTRDSNCKELKRSFSEMVEKTFFDILKKEFQKLDENKDEKLDLAELKKWVVEWADGYIFQKIDKNDDNQIDLKEFEEYISKHWKEIRKFNPVQTKL